MITGIIGPRGHGKTLLMSIRVFLRWMRMRKNGKVRILANYGIRLPHEKINLERLIALDEDLQNCIVAIDEIHVLFDSRKHGTDENILGSYFTTQTRKRNVIMFYTTQSEDQVEKRIRRNTDYWIYAKRIYVRVLVNGKKVIKKVIRNGKPEKVKWFLYQVYDGMTGAHLGKIRLFGRAMQAGYKLFDTTETITDFKTISQRREAKAAKNR